MMPPAVASAPLSTLSSDELSQLQKLPLAGPFYLPPLLSLWSEALRWQGLVLRSGNDCLIGFLRKSPLGKHFYALPFGMYSTLSADCSATQLDAFASWLRSRHLAESRLVLPQQLKFSELSGLHSRPFTFHLLDLTGDLEFSTNTRRNLQKAHDAGFSLKFLTPADTGAALRILRDHQSRTGEYRRLPASAYEHLFNDVVANPPGILAVALISSGQIIAVQLYFVSHDDAFYFDGFSLPAALGAGGIFYLMESMIRRLQSLGIKRLNLGASPPSDSGLRRFKEGWGARETAGVELYQVSAKKRLADLLRGRR